ncbi:c-type cytochrome [Candidatus Manganitrophus noduliformans]|nr:cytochrome c [Candidatus Manganitrophus noduliformans]
MILGIRPFRFYLPWLLTALLLFSGCGPARRSEPIAPPLSMSSSTLVRGEEAFMKYCNQCHPRGEAGLGPAINNKPLPRWLIRFQVRHGLGAMPAFSEKEIGDRELDDLVAYLKALR